MIFKVGFLFCCRNAGINVTIASENGWTAVKWRDLHSFKESETSFAIFNSINNAYLIPKRFFDSEEQMEALRRYASVLPTNRNDYAKALLKNQFKPSTIIFLVMFTIFVIYILVTAFLLRP